METMINNIDGSRQPNLPREKLVTYISLPQKINHKDSSFSSFIRPDDPNQVEDSEISIFDAQKYFNESSNDAKVVSKPVIINGLERISEPTPSVPRISSASASSVDGYGRNYRARSFNATPTASSEASWNSQTGLLSNPPGAIAVSIMRNPITTTTTDHQEMKKRSSSSKCGTKWLFGRKCPCSGKKSVQVEEKLSEPPKTNNNNRKQTQKSVEISMETSNWRREMVPNIINSHRRISADNNDHRQSRFSSSGRQYSGGGSAIGFTFPILNQTSSPVILNQNPIEDPPRESLEIFEPKHHHQTSVPPPPPVQTNPTVQSFTFQASPKSRMTMTDDDVASDASSDLFEIESFSTSTQTTTYMINRRDSLDEAANFNARRLMYCRRSLDEPSSIAPTECYEPSEASIDWSVTTAEGFDRGSISNFSTAFDDISIMRRCQEIEKTGTGTGGKKKGNGSGGLLSCRCEKAVSVGPNPVKCVPEPTGHVSCRPQNVNKPPLARSHSARLSLPFGT